MSNNFLERLLKIRNYAMNEDYKTSLLYYLEKKLERYVNKPEMLIGYVQCLADIREIPEIIEKQKG